MREAFGETMSELLDEDLSTVLVLADISRQYFRQAEAEHPERVINVGVREQLLVNVGAGLALSGLRPVVHTFSTFLVERAFEQIKLGFGHQDVGGVLVSVGGSYDVSSGGAPIRGQVTSRSSTRCRTSTSTSPDIRWRRGGCSGTPSPVTGGSTCG